MSAIQLQPDTVETLKGTLEQAESKFVEPIWRTPFYTPMAVDIWSNGSPEDAEVMYFGG